MRAAILNPGPSLLAFPPDFDGLVIATNRVGLTYRSDIWACLDLKRDDGGGVLRWAASVVGQPRLLTLQATSETVLRRRAWPSSFIIVEWFRENYAPYKLWSNLTSTAAIACAAHLGAKDIRCYGMDWSGAAGFDGVEAPAFERLVRERRAYEEIEQALAGAGVTVSRGD